MPDPELKPMTLKMDEDGHVVISDNKPVYVYEDGKEIAFDVSQSLLKIKELNSESKTNREASEALQQKLETWEGLDPEEARKALDTVQKLDESELIGAEKVQELEEKLKTQLGDIFKKKEEELLKEFQMKLDTSNETIGKHENTITELIKRNHFASSPWFVSTDGQPAKTVLPPDMAVDIFGKYFKVEGEGKDIKFVAYDRKGEKIASQDPNKLAEPADFNEAIGLILESHPNRHSIIRGTHGGPGDNKGLDPTHVSDGVIKIPAEHQKDPDYYRRVKETAAKTGAKVQFQ